MLINKTVNIKEDASKERNESKVMVMAVGDDLGKFVNIFSNSVSAY